MSRGSGSGGKYATYILIVALTLGSFVAMRFFLVTPSGFPVSVKLNRDTFSVNDRAELIFTNRGWKEVTYGGPYEIERLDGEDWMEASPFPSPVAWVPEPRVLPAWGTTRQKIKIDTLGLGHYRVHKKVDIEGGEAIFTLEFDIREGE
ncbi:hypothetical protein ISS40_02165 [Candidatus Bathyarchaeota archaeon]|nr:hypothetical protein [Candidatus Bathyarchaeota archaeon]